jgi:hypothetical protein
MRGAGIALGQIIGAGLIVAALGAGIGLLVVELATSKSASTGIGWGMVIAGGIAGLIVGGSGSPSENLVRARFYGTQYWGASAPLPQSPLQIALGGLLAFGVGIAFLVLTY